jgi:urease accessory protein
MTTIFSLLAPTLALAHPGHGVSGFAAGLAHPVFGLDHLLAALAVGIWAARARAGSHVLWYPAAFLFGTLAGGALGLDGLVFPYYDTGILISLAALGLGLAASVRLPVAQGAAILALFGSLHGNAHGVELAPGAGAAAFTGGFLLATAALHALGLLSAGALARRGAYDLYARAAGVACCLACALLWLR